MSSNRFAFAALGMACIASAASIAVPDTSSPSVMLPPSPRKMRAGRARLLGRKPAQAPLIANAKAATVGSPLLSASAPIAYGSSGGGVKRLPVGREREPLLGREFVRRPATG